MEFHFNDNLNMEAEDIMLTKEQAEYFLSQLKEKEELNGKTRVKRRAVVPTVKRWNLPISYMFDTTHCKSFGCHF